MARGTPEVLDKNGRPIHWPDCQCVLCVKFYKECKQCNKGYDTYAGYAKHMASKVHSEKPPKNKKRVAKTVIIPDGLGSLMSAFASEQKLQTLNLASICRFADAINSRLGVRKRQFNAKHRAALERMENSQDYVSNVDVPVMGQQGVAIFRIAKALRLPPGEVMSLLLAYGLELLASELNKSGTAPPARDPTISSVTVRNTNIRTISRSPMVPFAQDSAGDSDRSDEQLSVSTGEIRLKNTGELAPGQAIQTPRYL